MNLSAQHFPHPLAARGLRPVAELAAGREHGDRLRYAAGCRCSQCRAANAAYERGRAEARAAGDWNGTVPAEKARAWMAHLSAQGVGRRAIAEASDVAHSILNAIRGGRKTRIRALTERRILAVSVDMALDGALVAAGPTWALVDALLAAGFSKRTLALCLGQTCGHLQLSREQVTVRNADLVRQLHARLIDSEEALVDAKSTRRLIKELRTEGYTDKRIERELGLDGGIAQMSRRRVTLGVARTVALVHRRLTT